MRILMLIGLVLVLGSCANSYTNLSSTVIDDDFRKVNLRFRNTLGTPETISFYLKTYEQDGMLAFCGVSILTGRGVVDQLTDLWLNEAFVTVNGRSNKIVPARFIGQANAYDNEKVANCVKSNVPATPSNLYGHTSFAGSEIHYQ